MKNLLKKLISLNWQVEGLISISKLFYNRIPIIGKVVSLLIDRIMLVLYGIDLASFSINVNKLSISHPNGVLLGGNGIVSNGRVVIMSGVKFGGKSPSDEEYLKRHKTQSVFELGDNIVFCTSVVVLGPVKICDNVLIGAMSLVTKDINEPGIYLGIPAKKISDEITFDWVNHM